MGNSDHTKSSAETLRKQTCDMCDGGPLTCEIELQEFQYGSGSDTVILAAKVNTWTCANCGFKFTEGDAEERRHESVCTHLGVLTPAEIIALRKGHTISRAAFAELTDIGEASLKRWEHGLQIQSKSMDNYLRLLLVENVFQKLESLKTGVGVLVIIQKFSGQFRTQFTRATLQKCEKFLLRVEPA